MSCESSPKSSLTDQESNFFIAAAGKGDVETPNEESEMEVINLSQTVVCDYDIKKLGERKVKNVPFRKRKIGQNDDEEESTDSGPSNEQTASLAKPTKNLKATVTNSDSDQAIATSTVAEASFSLASAQANLNFPQRLRRAIDDDKNHEILRWLPHGLSFKVFEKEDFERIILPKYFQKQSKYWSFTRKLGRWGFVRITSGSESGSYQHPFFKRDEPELISQMTCQSSAVGSSALSAHSPNFKLAQGQLNLDDRKIPAINKGGRTHSSSVGSLSTIDEVRRRANAQGAFTREAGQSANNSASHPFLQAVPAAGLQLDALTEQQLLVELAARSSGTALPKQSMLASLQAGGVRRGGPYRDIELLDDRKRFLLSQELLRQQMQQNEESLLLRLMLENRRNQLSSTPMGVQPPQRNMPAGILDNNRLSNLELLRMQVAAAAAADSPSARNAGAVMHRLSPPSYANDTSDNASLLSFLTSRSGETPQQGSQMKPQQEQQQAGVSDDLAAQILHLQNLHRQQQQQQPQRRKPDHNDQQSDSSTK